MLFGALLGQPAIATENAVANKYRSCSYPKSKPSEYKPNAKSWKAQGFKQAIRGIDISVWQHPDGKAIDFAQLKS